MLIAASNISPGDEVVTSRHRGIVERVELLEDGSVHLVFTGGLGEWFRSSQILLKKDKFSVFFAPDPVQ